VPLSRHIFKARHASTRPAWCFWPGSRAAGPFRHGGRPGERAFLVISPSFFASPTAARVLPIPSRRARMTKLLAVHGWPESEGRPRLFKIMHLDQCRNQPRWSRGARADQAHQHVRSAPRDRRASHRLVSGGPPRKVHHHTRPQRLHRQKAKARLTVEDKTTRSARTTWSKSGRDEHSLSNLGAGVFEIFEIYAPSGKQFDFVLDGKEMKVAIKNGALPRVSVPLPASEASGGEGSGVGGSRGRGASVVSPSAYAALRRTRPP